MYVTYISKLLQWERNNAFYLLLCYIRQCQQYTKQQYTKGESVKHNTYIILKISQRWLHVSAFQGAIIRPAIK
jgi:hypothetical protein